MKIFVFEYITGGGMTDETLPNSMAKEGDLMLSCLLEDLQEIDDIEIFTSRDGRLSPPAEIAPEHLFIIHKQEQLRQQLIAAINRVDAVWIIAPETGLILAELCALVEQQGIPLLMSSSAAVLMAGNKLATANLLGQNAIPCVLTQKITADVDFTQQSWVVKPNDGVGCDGCYRIETLAELHSFYNSVDVSNYIMQPYIAGKALSLSCLFNKGAGQLICCNEQKIAIKQNRFELSACIVNIERQYANNYQILVNQIALTMPKLWGYVGIDLIKTETEILLLEVNPRLTTSYCGIRQALGINLAEKVLGLLQGDDLTLSPLYNSQITIPTCGDN